VSVKKIPNYQSKTDYVDGKTGVAIVIMISSLLEDSSEGFDGVRVQSDLGG